MSPLRNCTVNSRNMRILANSSPIQAASSQTAQQSIMSMEDDEISDQETVSKINCAGTI